MLEAIGNVEIAEKWSRLKAIEDGGSGAVAICCNLRPSASHVSLRRIFRRSSHVSSKRNELIKSITPTSQCSLGIEDMYVL